MPASMACRRNSVAVSIRMLTPSACTQRELRVRLFFGLSLVQTGQVQVMIGTPWEVPVPKKVISTFYHPFFPLTGTCVLEYNKYHEHLFAIYVPKGACR